MFKRKHNKMKKKVSPSKQVLLSFFLVIICGTILLALPISNKLPAREIVDYLFIATSATCVTGLVPVATVQQFTLFGQLVLVLLMQIGGLGFLTFLILFVTQIQQKVSISNRGIVTEALNLDSSLDIKVVLKKILMFTFMIEFTGFVLLAIPMVMDFGLFDGLFKALFTAVSAFCNAGFDNIGTASLAPYITNPLVNIVVCILIIVGGLGFTVWFDVEKKSKKYMHKDISFHRFFTALSLHTKLVLTFTFILLVGGTVLVLITEFNNPATLGNLNILDKIQVAFFTSTTLRTAGFATIDFGALRLVTQFLMLGFMFIGGSPGSTAGGVKTTTFFVLFLTLVSNLRGNNHTSSYKKSINNVIIIRAVTIILASFLLMFVAVCLLLATQPQLTFMEILFEAISALATVGLSLNVTAQLNTIGKIIIIVLMYCGRVGVMTMVVFFMNKHNSHIANEIAYPNENVLIG